MPSARRIYTVVRDRWAEGLGREELSLFADELSDRELIGLQEPYRSEALREIRCILEEDRHGQLCVVTDPALDGGDTAAPAVSEAA